jgi:anthranilate phosphoribosyltransferase
MPLVAEVLALTGSEHVMIVHSQDGLDEISISAPTDYLELKSGKITEGTLSPEDVGLRPHPAGSLAGGEAEENLRIFHSVLEGEPGAYRDVVVFNAAAMVYVSGQMPNIKSAVERAIEAIDSGKAKEKLNAWVAFTQK